MERTLKLDTTARRERGLAHVCGEIDGNEYLLARLDEILDSYADQADADMRRKRREALESLGDEQQELITKILMAMPAAGADQKSAVDTHVAALAEALGVEIPVK
jgi:hypothetical protein